MNTAFLVFVALLQRNAALRLNVHSPESENNGAVGGHLSKDAVRDWFYNTHPALQPKSQDAFAAAQLASKQGKPLLLQETLKIFKTTEEDDLYDFDIRHTCGTDLDKYVDVLLDDNLGWAPLIEWFQLHHEGIPIVKFGWCRQESRPGSDGSVSSKLRWQDFGHDMFGAKWRSAKEKLQGRKFTALMAGNENWGIFSLWHPNRTTTWRVGIDDDTVSDIHSFLDDPSLVAFFHMQHSDVPHPKIINFPLARFNQTWHSMKGNHFDSVSQTLLLAQYGGHWSYRQILFEEFQERFGVDFHAGSSTPVFRRLLKPQFMDALARTKFHAVPSGLGIDCYSIWESIAAGTIPIVERGFGMDSVLGQLPVLSVDSFADVSKELLHAIHPYFLMHASDFHWALLRKTTWIDGMHGSPKILASFLNFRLPPSPNTYLDSQVKPAHCKAERVECAELFPEKNMAEAGYANCCAAKPGWKGLFLWQWKPMATQLLYGNDKVHPWAWDFKGYDEI